MEPVDPQSLVSLSERNELQLIFDKCVRIAGNPPYDPTAVDRMLRECVRRDPGNAIYVEAYLQNLDAIAAQSPARRLSWLRRRNLVSARRREDWQTVLRLGLDASSRCTGDAEPNYSLALATWTWGWEESALRFLHRASALGEESCEINDKLAELLMRTGQFEYARHVWQRLETPHARRIAELLAPSVPDDRQQRRLEELSQQGLERQDLGECLQFAGELFRDGHLESAAELSQRLLTVSPGEQATYELLEEIRIAQARRDLELADQLCREELVDAPLVQRFEENLNRVELEVLTNRTQRQPDHAGLAYQLGLRLKWARSFAEAIPCLTQALKETELEWQARVELGECAQQLYRFDEARGWYESVQGQDQADAEARQRAVYRLAVLELADGNLERSKELFGRLPENYRQTAHHLDKINQIGDKG